MPRCPCVPTGRSPKRRCVLAVTLLAVSLVLCLVRPAAAQSPDRLVLAFYYTWS